MEDISNLKNDYSEDFWESISNLDNLTINEVIKIIEMNSIKKVPMPETILLKSIQELDKPKYSSQVKYSVGKKHLLKDRISNGDFFIAESPDLPYLRSDMASMENPLFALKAGDTRIIEYFSTSKDKTLKTTIRGGAEIGRATIFDKDVWIYAISKLMQAKFDGNDITSAVEVSASDFFKATNRGDGGNQFVLFRDALRRLSATRIETEIETGGVHSASGFGLLDEWEVLEENSSKIPLKVVIQLPQWLYRSIESNEVLAISNDYFRLKKPIDRRIYEIARKHCGRQVSWKISLDKLHQKTGATMASKYFRQAILSLIKANVLPDYRVCYDRDSDMVTFHNLDETVLIEANKRSLKALIKRNLKTQN